MTGQHHEIEGSIAAYALDTMTETERAVVLPDLLDHLSSCDACRSLYHEFRETAGDLALAAPPHPVSEELETKVMDAVRGERRAPATPPRRRNMFVRGLMAASLAAVVALGSLSYVAMTDLREERSRAGRSERILSVLADPSLERYPLRGTNATGTLTLTISQDGRAVLVGAGLPAIDRDRVFELWLMQGGVPVPAGVFRAEQGKALVLLKHDPRRYDAAAITVEPGPNGTTAPSSDVIYSVSLRA